MKFHSPPSSPPKAAASQQPTFQRPKAYIRPEADPSADVEAAKANELLNLRSQNISHIIKQREASGAQFSAHSSITLPEANPRINHLHQELGIDKVVLVKCPFEIDTTPGGYYKNASQTMEGGGS